MLSDKRVYYDGQAFGAGPTHGDVSKTEKVASYSGGSPVYGG